MPSFLENPLKCASINLRNCFHGYPMVVLPLFLILNGCNWWIEISPKCFIVVAHLFVSNLNMFFLHFIKIKWSITLLNSTITHYLVHSSMSLWFSSSSLFTISVVFHSSSKLFPSCINVDDNGGNNANDLVESSNKVRTVASSMSWKPSGTEGDAPLIYIYAFTTCLHKVPLFASR